MKVQTSAKLRYLRTSPRKVRLLIDLIRGSQVNDALAQLQLSKKHASEPVIKLLKSAIANATHNDNVDPATLVVKTAFVDGGPILYRWMPRAFGRATKIRKRTSHITIVLEGEVKEVAKKETKKKESTDNSQQTTDTEKKESVDSSPSTVDKKKKATASAKATAAKAKKKSSKK